MHIKLSLQSQQTQPSCSVTARLSFVKDKTPQACYIFYPPEGTDRQSPTEGTFTCSSPEDNSVPCLSSDAHLLSVCLSPPVCLSFCLVFLFISDFHIRIFPPSLSRSLSSSLQLCKHFQVRLSCQPTRQTQVLCAEGFIQYFLLVSELDTGVVKTEQKITVSGMLLKVWM